jgi:hypothetical protein
MNRNLLIVASAAFCALAATAAYPSTLAPEEHVGVDAERGDPARWYVPADTPRLKYETLVKEADAALGEALKDCRAQQSGRGTCIAEAKAQHRRDREEARRVLSKRRGPT